MMDEAKLSTRKLWTKEPFSAGLLLPAKPFLPHYMRRRIMQVLDESHEGISYGDFLMAYKKKYGEELNWQSMGFKTVYHCLEWIPEIKSKFGKERFTIVSSSKEAKEEEHGKNIKKLTSDLKGCSIECEDQKDSNFCLSSISKTMKDNFTKILLLHPDGITASDFLKYYEKLIGDKLHLKEMGILNFVDLADSLPEIFKPVPSSIRNTHGLPFFASEKLTKSKVPEEVKFDLLCDTPYIDKIIKNIRMLLRAHPEGVDLDEFIHIYKLNCEEELKVSEFGCISVESFLLKISQRVPLVIDDKFFHRRVRLSGSIQAYGRQITNILVSRENISTPSSVSSTLSDSELSTSSGLEPSTASGSEPPVASGLEPSTASGVEPSTASGSGPSTASGLEPSVTEDLTNLENPCLWLNIANDVVPPWFSYELQKFPNKVVQHELVPVYISTFIDPSNMYLQLVGSSTSYLLDVLLEEMDSFYKSPSGDDYVISDEHILHGGVCAGIYDTDGFYYRIFVFGMNFDRNFVDALFVDYGTKAKVSRKSLRYLRQKFFDLPAQAIKSHMAFVKPRNGYSWSKRACDRMIESCQDKMLMAELIKATLYPDSVSVWLCASSGKEDVYLNLSLIDEGLAVFDATEVEPPMHSVTHSFGVNSPREMTSIPASFPPYFASGPGFCETHPLPPVIRPCFPLHSTAKELLSVQSFQPIQRRVPVSVGYGKRVYNPYVSLQCTSAGNISSTVPRGSSAYASFDSVARQNPENSSSQSNFPESFPVPLGSTGPMEMHFPDLGFSRSLKNTPPQSTSATSSAPPTVSGNSQVDASCYHNKHQFSCSPKNLTPNFKSFSPSTIQSSQSFGFDQYKPSSPQHKADSNVNFGMSPHFLLTAGLPQFIHHQRKPHSTGSNSGCYSKNRVRNSGPQTPFPSQVISFSLPKDSQFTSVECPPKPTTIYKSPITSYPHTIFHSSLPHYTPPGNIPYVGCNIDDVYPPPPSLPRMVHNGNFNSPPPPPHTIFLPADAQKKQPFAASNANAGCSARTIPSPGVTPPLPAAVPSFLSPTVVNPATSFPFPSVGQLPSVNTGKVLSAMSTVAELKAAANAFNNYKMFVEQAASLIQGQNSVM